MLNKWNGKSNVCGKLIYNRRLEMNLSQNDLCAKLAIRDISLFSSDITHIENGTRLLKDFELIIIFDILNINFKELSKVLNEM